MIQRFPTNTFGMCPLNGETGKEFLRGFIAAGLLGAVQERQGQNRLDRRTLRLALQGGSALAAGANAARAWQAGHTVQALVNVAIGAGAVIAAEHFLKDSTA